MRAPRFALPSAPRGNPLWGAASVVVHALVILVLVSVAGPSLIRERVAVVELLPPGTPGPREQRMPAYTGVPGGIPSGDAEGGGGGVRSGIVPSARVDTTLPPPEPRYVIGPEGGAGDSLTLPGPPGRRRLLRPAYGDGRLWVRANEAELGVVGPSDDMATHVARVDSAVRARIKAFVDTMPRDSFAVPPPPKWTTEIAGNTWGIDRSWIYLGDFKLPTALLALLPLPQGNIDRARDAAELQRIREEIISAARRAESAEQFRRYVNELRKRKDEERARRRAVRDTIIP